MANEASSDPRQHVENIKSGLQGLIEHVRQDVHKVRDPRAQALFETTAEVLSGLKKAYDDFDSKSEPGWR